MYHYLQLPGQQITQPRSVRNRVLRYCFPAWICIFILASTATGLASQRIASLHPYLQNGGYALQVNDKVIRSFNLGDHFIPASTIKVLTSLMALEILGPSYRFVTEIYQDKENNLYIRGEGDPLLVSESVAKIADALKAKNIRDINTLFLDATAFDLDGHPPGSDVTDNPYDANSGALAVNFNALPFKILKNGQVVSGEEQTPYLPLMADCAQNYRAGSHRVNVSSFTKELNCSNVLRYSGELFIAIFKEKGITVTNGFSMATVPATAKLLLSYVAEKTVADIVRLTLKYSSNFMANQLFLSCGRRIHGFPATWAKAEKTAKQFIGLRLGLKNNEIRMVDGSGLSSDNRITPAAMLIVLNRFKPYADLLRKKDDVLIKSGTLTGVYCYVGYFQKEAELSPFVIFLNQRRNKRKLLLRLMHEDFLTLAQLQNKQHQ